MSKKIALIIGVSEYINADNLPPCKRDIELISTIVSGSKKYDDILILSENSKSVEAKEKITSFIRANQGLDIEEVFIYYTGHGARHGDDFIFLFSDFDRHKIEQTSFRNSEFDSMLKSLNPKLAIKVIDACQSGTEYIKSNNDLQTIFEKSSSECFTKTYFLFSSSKSESSKALGDFSVFTKSLARSLLNFEEQDIRYRDIMAYISDDQSVKKHQTPLFIQQADNTEIFCFVSADLTAGVKSVLAPLASSEAEDLKSDARLEEEQSEEEKLISAIRIESQKYCSEEEAQISLSKLIENISNHSWQDFITELYTIKINTDDKVPSLDSVKSIAKWLHESKEPYFVNIVYNEEEYEEKERVEIEEVHPFYLRSLYGRTKRIEYQPTTKYRNVISKYDLTASSPCKSICISLSPKEEALPWLKLFFAFAFSKSKLTIFFKHEIEKETSWSNRIIEDSNQWKTGHCAFKDFDSIEKSTVEAFNDIENSIMEIIKSRIS